MLCDKCQKNQATIHMTQIINGVKEEQHLCEECAKESGVGMGSPISFQDLFQGFLNIPSASSPQTHSSQRCPECGMSFDELRQTGKLGCAACYNAFRPQIESTLKSIHGSTRHKGKLAKDVGGELLTRKELESLQKQLSKAIAAEEYEEAARLRDAIRELEKGA